MGGSTIVVCVDGSTIADNAFNFAIDKVYKENDTLLILRVPEYDFSLSALGANWEKVCADVKKADTEIECANAKYIELLRSKGINGKSVKPKGGKAGEVIVETARTEGATHIIMGTRGLGKLQRAFIGSVSQYVLNHSAIPVTIVPKQ